jgi:BirA family biotin operon repressor/biotin-[acetyl-CoA-carboxylase] ligase
MEQARSGAPEGLVAVADHQTAGRGRLGRTWEAPAGANLLCSVLLRPPVVSNLVVACVALAGRDAAQAVARVDAGLKWPNDLLVDGAKLAGVLAEAEAGAVVVGIGMNVGWAPPGAARLGAGTSRDAVLDAFLDALDRWYAAGDAAVASAYRVACVTLGQPVRVELADETFDGTAADIDDDGHLLVEVGMCLRTVAAGDVIHLR